VIRGGAEEEGLWVMSLSFFSFSIQYLCERKHTDMTQRVSLDAFPKPRPIRLQNEEISKAKHLSKYSKDIITL